MDNRVEPSLIGFWWCGSRNCRQHHKSEEAASLCNTALKERYGTTTQTHDYTMVDKVRLGEVLLRLYELGWTRNQLGLLFGTTGSAVLNRVHRAERVRKSLTAQGETYPWLGPLDDSTREQLNRG